jgi:HlyD family secretion protein
MKNTILTLIILATVGGGGYAYFNYRNGDEAPTISTARVTRGDISDSVGATGTLQAVTTVQVGTQVSGTIAELNADFNSLVRKGQVLARLDPSLFETQIEQAQANLIRAQADLERLEVTLEDAEIKLKRAKELAARRLIPQTELDAAEVAVRSTAAQIRSSQAQVTQARASLNQNQVNLQHTVIVAPIDGMVISRDVDVGQTVAASMSAPTLFVLAADLTKMQVLANIDESDVGRIRPGQAVSFLVDAYPADDFTGTVSQVRLQAQVVQNVVTYSTVIDVPNDELKLKPGMTANVTIEIARRSDVIRVPNTSLRFRPTNDMYAALGQTPPEMGPPGHVGPGGGTTGRVASQGGEAPDGAEGKLPGSGGAEAVTGRGAADQAAIRERLQGLPAEERAAVLERMQARGLDRSGATGDGSQRRARGSQIAEANLRTRNPEATTIDGLFGPLPRVESTGRVWRYVDGELRPVRVRLGITDGQVTELLEGDLQPDMELVTNIATSTAETRPTPQGGNPFMRGGGRRFR